MKQSYSPWRDPKSYGFILPAPVMQSVPREGAQEIEAEAVMITQPAGAIGQYKVPKRHTVIQHPSETRVIACIVFTKKGLSDMKPSDFMKHPYDSIMHKMEDEIVARNIMVILKRTGNKFRRLSWEEYKSERLKDGAFSEVEKESFDHVIIYCVSAKAAQTFSDQWQAKKG